MVASKDLVLDAARAIFGLSFLRLLLEKSLLGSGLRLAGRQSSGEPGCTCRSTTKS